MRRVLSETDLRDFRDRVCTAATELLAELGLDGFNMRELAGRLGVSAMTTYRYFDSKDDIFASLRVLALNALADRLEGLADSSGTPRERLMSASRTYLDFAREKPIRYRLMFDLSQTQSLRSAEQVNAERRVFGAFVDLASLVARDGQPAMTAERLAQSLWVSLHGFAALSHVEAFRKSELDGLLFDMICRFAEPNGRIVEFEHRVRGSAGERQPHATERTNVAVASAWIPLTAAE